MQVIQLLGSAMGLACVAGINLYATVLTLGIGIRFEFVHLPPDMNALSVLAHQYVPAAAGVAYIFEFFADKIPWADTLWDTFHTFIRPAGAAFLGMKAVTTADPAAELSIMLLCGWVAFFSHTSKASVRFVANHSPEPFSNIVLSVAEDIIFLSSAGAGQCCNIRGQRLLSL